MPSKSSTEVVTVLVKVGNAIIKSSVDGTRDKLSASDDWGFSRIQKNKPVVINAVPSKSGYWRIYLTNRTKNLLEVTTRVGFDELTDVISSGEQLSLKKDDPAIITIEQS